MRYPILAALVVAFLACALSACQTGPGADCDDCAVGEANASAPFAQAAQASASGGQDASNQPTQKGALAKGIYTPISRGAGNQSLTTTTEEAQSQAGAPSVNQGLVLPTEASARNGGGVSPVVASLQALIEGESERLMGETDPQERAAIRATISGYVQAMAQAQASSKGTVQNVYNFDGARIVQSVANGSNSGDGTTAIDPNSAAAVGKPLAEAARSVMEAGSSEKPAAPSTSPSAIPEASPSPSGSDVPLPPLPVEPAEGGE